VDFFFRRGFSSLLRAQVKRRRSSEVEVESMTPACSDEEWLERGGWHKSYFSSRSLTARKFISVFLIFIHRLWRIFFPLPSSPYRAMRGETDESLRRTVRPDISVFAHANWVTVRPGLTVPSHTFPPQHLISLSSSQTEGTV
jgi:hypothetical protein